MKQITVVFKAVLLIAILAPLAACSGGTFIDPGHGAWGGGGGYDLDGSGDGGGNGGNGDGNGGGSKPSLLSENATYDQAVATLDEIINYCTAYPNGMNKSTILSAQGTKTAISSATVKATWNTHRSVFVSTINTFISILE